MAYQTGFHRWDFSASIEDLDTSGILSAPGALALDPGVEPREDLEDGLRARSAHIRLPTLVTEFPFTEVIPSWNADCPEDSSVEVELRTRSRGAWTRWYCLGYWGQAVEGPLGRGSVSGQHDEYAKVSTDTLVLASEAEAVQARLRLIALPGASSPSLRAFSLTYSSAKPKTFPLCSEPGMPAHLIEGVPEHSQMVYPDGGKVWCSPTCVSMILGYWEGERLPSEERLRKAVAGVYDPVYEGHGNWAFNAAYAGGLGYEAALRRFSSLRELEPWIAADIPLALSVSWNEESGRPLPGAPISKSSGHLTLLVGFDALGNPIMNEPASPSHDCVRRSYPRAEFEARWLEASGGLAYLIVPRKRAHPGW